MRLFNVFFVGNGKQLRLSSLFFVLPRLKVLASRLKPTRAERKKPT